MTRNDKQLLFSALGFLAIAMKGNADKKGAAIQAQTISGLIESYCRETLPDAFPMMFEERDEGEWSIYDLIIQRAKDDIKKNGKTKLPENYDLKTMIYHRLQKRQRNYMSSEIIEDEINHLLNLETKHIKNEAQMMIVNIQGDADAFTPYERMTNAIAEVLKTKEECFPSDLDDSFTDEEVKHHWRMAYALAQVERMGEENNTK